MTQKNVNALAPIPVLSDEKLNAHSMIRTGSKVPYSTSVDGREYSYLDVGVSIDCFHVVEMHDTISVAVKADISSIMEEPTLASAATRQPVVRQNKWQAGVVVPIKKPTVVFSSDDLTTKRQMQIELTATPIP